MITPQIEIWKSDFGKEWVERNLPNIDISARARTFRKILKGLNIFSVLEIGCSAGQNLDALADIAYARYGLDPMECIVGRDEGGLQTRVGDIFEIPAKEPCFDLLLTCGTMMHVAPHDMLKAVTEVRRASKGYILTIEYFADKDEAIPWRGYDNLLFKRNYADYFPNLISRGDLNNGSGFDHCSYWLFKK